MFSIHQIHLAYKILSYEVLKKFGEQHDIPPWGKDPYKLWVKPLVCIKLTNVQLAKYTLPIKQMVKYTSNRH